MVSNNKTTLESVLKKQKYISVTTFKRSGQGVPTPVWFVLREGKVYFRSEINTWKVKRLRNNNSVEFAPCTVIGKVTGHSFNGTTVLLKSKNANEAMTLIKKKFPLRFRLFKLFSPKTEYVVYEITPSE